MNSPRTPKTLPHYLAEKIAAQRELGNSEEQVANTMGFESPRFLQMIMRGEAKLPIDKVLPLSRALNVEPQELFQRAMRQFMSDREVDELFGTFDINERSAEADVGAGANDAVPTADDRRPRSLEPNRKRALF